MAAHAFDYLDYHRTIIAFHGTTEETADRLVCGEPFQISESEDDWFGKGVYFWEYAPQQAWWWAREFKSFARPAVIGAIIRLGHSFDLLDSMNVKALRGFHDELIEELQRANREVPRSFRHHRNLDCAVFDYYYKKAEDAGKAIDCARAVYVPTASAKRVWPGSWIYEEAHIQICVRNARNILAVWHVRPDGRYGKQAADGLSEHG